MAVAIQAEKLLRELDDVWVSLGKDQRDTGGVLRACAMTLVTMVDAGPQRPDAAETVAELMHDHPARAIVVRVGGEGELSAHTTAQCWMPFGRRQQICCEQIEIAAPGGSLEDVPAVLRGLMVPDLPVVLWIRNAALLQHPEIDPFLALAHKVIVESRGYADTAGLIAKLKSISKSGISVADLAWTRITRWRETLARVFDDAARGDALRSAREATVRHSPPAPGPAALYLATWIGQALPSTANVRLEMASGGTAWQIQEVRASGEYATVAIRRREKGFVEIEAGSSFSGAVFQQLRETDLLREELSIVSRDVVFERVLAAL